jgi:hypothetical protein
MSIIDQHCCFFSDECFWQANRDREEQVLQNEIEARLQMEQRLFNEKEHHRREQEKLQLEDYLKHLVEDLNYHVSFFHFD